MSVAIDPPVLTDVEAAPAAVIHLTIPRDRIQAEMEPAIGEILAAIANQGLKPDGPLFAHHLTMSPHGFDFEVGFPVSGSLQAEGRVQAGERPGGSVIRTVYQGPYEGLHEAWEAFGHAGREQLAERLEERGLVPDDSLWESYLTGPESGPDATTYRTELNLRLRSGR